MCRISLLSHAGRAPGVAQQVAACVLLAANVTVLALVLAGPGWAQGVTFGERLDFATGNGPISAAIGDLNGDGKPDLAVANFGNGESSNTVSVLLGDGAGGFGAKSDFATGIYARCVAIGDLNGDGRPDLAVANWGSTTVSVLPGNGAGGFGINTDFGAGSNPVSVAIGDLNGDGKPDLAVANWGSGTVSVLLGNGAGGFGSNTDFATGSVPYWVAIGDLNGDGKPDLAVANEGSNTVSVLLGDGAGGFGTTTDFATGDHPVSAAIGDLNGDGTPDLAVANYLANSVSVFPGDGAGGFGTATDFATGAYPISAAIGDLNGDGKPDLAVVNQGSGAVSVLLGDGAGGFGATTDFATGSTPYPAAVGDLNGDGKPDLAVPNYSSNTVSVLLNTTPRSNHAPVLGLPGSLTVSEGDSVSFTATATDPDLPPDALTFSLLPPSPAGASIDSRTGAVGWRTVDDASVTFRVGVDDGRGGSAEGDVPVTVANVAPVPSMVQPAFGALYPMGATVPFSGNFTDPGSVDTHTATWSCDAIGIPGTVAETSRTVTGSYPFAAPGVYLVSLTVRDDDGGVGVATTVAGNPAVVVIYDPTAGFVTGSGWFASPPGAVTAHPEADGRAVLAFVSKYQASAAVPTGEMRLRFRDGDLAFESSAYSWLVVGGRVAEFAGTGTVNGGGSYGFQLGCVDGDLVTPAASDQIRVRIWDAVSGQTVYDTQMGAPASDRPSTAMGGGAIAIKAGASYQQSIDPLVLRPDVPTPGAFALGSIVPNPFTEAACVAFDLPVTSRVRMTVHDVTGRKVADVLDAVLGPSRQVYRWPGRDASSHALEAGVYFLRFQALPLDGSPGLNAVRKVVRMR